MACRTDFVTKVKRFGLLAEGEPYRQIIFLRELGGGSRRPLRFGVRTDWGKQRLRSRRVAENDRRERRERQNDFTVVEVEIRAAAFPPLTLSARQSTSTMRGHDPIRRAAPLLGRRKPFAATGYN